MSLLARALGVLPCGRCAVSAAAEPGGAEVRVIGDKADALQKVPGSGAR